MVTSRRHRLRVPATHTDIPMSTVVANPKQRNQTPPKLPRGSEVPGMSAPGAGRGAPLPGLEGLQSRTPQAVMPCLYFQERHRLLRSIATVIGPTPPGTGEISFERAPHSVATAPHSFAVTGSLQMPASTMTTPRLIMSGVIGLGVG